MLGGGHGAARDGVPRGEDAVEPMAVTADAGRWGVVPPVKSGGLGSIAPTVVVAATAAREKLYCDGVGE